MPPGFLLKTPPLPHPPPLSFPPPSPHPSRIPRSRVHPLSSSTSPSLCSLLLLSSITSPRGSSLAQFLFLLFLFFLIPPSLFHRSSHFFGRTRLLAHLRLAHYGHSERRTEGWRERPRGTKAPEMQASEQSGCL